MKLFTKKNSNSMFNDKLSLTELANKSKSAKKDTAKTPIKN